MAKSILTRRAFLSKSSITTLAATTVLLADSTASAVASAETPAPKAITPLEKKLDAYVALYMSAMNAPGMTLALTDVSFQATD